MDILKVFAPPHTPPRPFVAKRFMRRLFLILTALVLSGSTARAADILPPADVRFADAKTTETPSFQRHVLPLMGRLGCNGRACHGSFQGQGGFRLSLFGYDFAADHEALVQGDAPRVDLQNVAASLILRKPTLQDDHDGGERFKPKSWQYRVLEKWIAGGATPVAETDPQFVSLTVEPTEILFDKPGATQQLKLTVAWSDGTREDVTPLCRFQTNDESVAAVDENGLITCKGKGDTHVVAFYDNGVAPTAVLVPHGERRGDDDPRTPTPTRIDELVVAKLRKLGTEQSDVCTDAEFLRRVSLDMTGTLPAPDEVRKFLADKSQDKRARKIEELLERPTYAAWQATRLCDWMGNAEANGPVGGEQGLRRRFSEMWYDWVTRRVRENVPYDEIVEGIVLGVGRRAEQTPDEYFAEMSAYFRADKPADFTARDTMPYFWHRRSLGNNDGKALAFAYSFLGVRLECAQCHKHPFDQWTKQDFDEFAAFFNGVRYANPDRTVNKEMLKPFGLDKLDEDSGDFKRQFVAALDKGNVMPFKSIAVPAPRKVPSRPAKPNPKLGRVITPHLLGGDEVVTHEYSDPRLPLMDWMRDEDNPYFARALVNRVWADYFGVGIIDPPDDMNLANPPSNAPLLDWLAREFVKQRYDLKWLHRTIANSRTYQLSWKPNATNARDERNYSRALVRRIPAEAAYDALVTAAANDEARNALTHDPTKVRARAIGAAAGYSGTKDENLYAAALFGKPLRLTNCDCERSGEPTLLQTVYLQNDAEVTRQLDGNDGWISQLYGDLKPTGPKATRKPKPGPPPADDVLIDEAYLRTLSRLPTDAERTIAREQLAKPSDDPRGNLRTLLWALVNTKEFILNH